MRERNSSLFLNALKVTLQCVLITQAAVFLLGVGKWYDGVRYEGTFNDPNQYGVFVLFSAFLIKNTAYIVSGIFLIS